MAARSFCLLALEIWAGRGPWSAKVRAGQVPGERSERLWGSCPEPVGPQRSGGRGLARSGSPATIGGPERQNHRQGQGRVSGTCRVGHGSAISPTGVQLV